MKDQSFKRYFPSNHAKQRQSYKYPTYKHYYEPKNHKEGELQDDAHNNQNQPGIKKSLIEEKTNPTISNQSNRNHLKQQLQNLKLQVYKIMQQKQNVLRNSIQKKFFPQSQIHKYEKDSPQLQKDKEYTDNQSIESEHLSKQQSQGLSPKPSRQNFDHNKHLQIQNNLLKTELKNLKGKYANKKREMKERCDELQNKIRSLQNDLETSQQSLKNEIINSKQTLQEAKKLQLALEIQTLKKQQEALITTNTIDSNQTQQFELLTQKINQLSQDLSAKNKIIQEQQMQITRISNNLTQSQRNYKQYKQKIQQIIVQKEQTHKGILEQVYKKLKRSQSKVEELQNQIQKLQNNDTVTQQSQLAKRNFIQIQSKFDFTKKEYQYNLQQTKIQIDQLKGEISSINNAKRLMQQQIKYLHSQKKLNEQNIQSLKEKIQFEKSSSHTLEEIYKVNLQAKQRQYQELLKNIQTEYHKKSKAGSNHKSSGNYENKRVESSKEIIGEESILQKQVKKWKIQYKLLKQRYEAHVSRENKNKNQFQEYYSTYRESKNKLEIYTHKINILQKQLQNYMNLLTGKQNELIKKQIEIRRIENQQTLSKNKSAYQISALTEKYKQLEERYNEEIQKNQKEVAYRKQIQNKISASADTNDSSLNEVIERMKKRLIEQDEKLNKNVKELKSKDALNTKLKQQLREIIQNLEKKMNSQKNEEIKQLLEESTKRQTIALENWKERTEKQQKVLEESNHKLLTQILTFKNSLTEKDKQVMTAQNEVKLIKSSYNMKCLQISDALQQKQLLIQQYIQQLEEADVLKEHVQNVLNQQIQRRNDEINSLREQLLAKITKSETYSKYNPSFDQILKSHMETSTKLREDVNKKTEEIFKLRDNYSSLRSQYQNLKSEIDISKLKMLSQKKNLEVNYQIQTQNLKNQIASEGKKFTSLQQKIKVVIEQNKKKDAFIQTYIMGKKLPQNEKELVTAFIKKYQITLGNSDIVERLQADIKQIQKLNLYNDSLLKQVSILKEKVLLFEAIDQQKLSFYQSKFSISSQKNIKEETFEDINLHKQKNRNKVQKSESLNVHVIGQKQTQ